MVRPTGRRESGNGGGRYKGVRMRKWGRWVAEIRQPNSRERIWLGSYESPEEAARAYDAAVTCLRGPNALLNFPDDPPPPPPPPPENTVDGKMLPSQVQVAASRHARRLPSSTTCHEEELELARPIMRDHSHQHDQQAEENSSSSSFQTAHILNSGHEEYYVPATDDNNTNNNASTASVALMDAGEDVRMQADEFFFDSSLFHCAGFFF